MRDAAWHSEHSKVEVFDDRDQGPGGCHPTTGAVLGGVVDQGG